jgi:hypothetical protein
MFKSVILVASLVASATAQSIKIGYPSEGATVKSGSNITVMVERPVRALRPSRSNCSLTSHFRTP